MALNIKNQRVHALAREAAERTGRSQTSVIEQALERLLADLGNAEAPAVRRGTVVRGLVEDFHAGLTPQERRGIRDGMDALYDEAGLPA